MSIDFSNPWVVGIGTAVISGLAVNFISRPFLTRKDDKDRRRQIDGANQEVLNSLIPAIAEAIVPSLEIIQALVSSTAKKYGVQQNELMTTTEFADDLIKAVMDSNFISTDQKLKYCEGIIGLKHDFDASRVNKENPTELRLGSNDPQYRYRQKVLNQFIVAISLTTAALAATAAGFITASGGFDLLTDLQVPLSLVSVAVVVPFVFMVLDMVYRRQDFDKRANKKLKTKVKDKLEI